MGAGAIPGDHPLCCGVPWIAGGADMKDVVAACDAFLAVGTRFNQGMTADWNLPLPALTIRIDIDPDEIERNLPMQHKLVGDAKKTLAALDRSLSKLGVAREGQVPPKLAQAQATFRAGLLAKAGSTKPWMDALRAALPRDAILSCDMSLFWADMLSIFPIYEPRTMLFPWGFWYIRLWSTRSVGGQIGDA